MVWIVVSVLLFVFAAALPYTAAQPGVWCRAGRRYYAVGANWTSPRDPCTVHQCLDTGNARVVSKGCSFKGDCKPVGSTWSENCNVFQCFERGNLRYYTLVQSGCMDETGACRKIGNRTVDGCDVSECQIHENYLVFKKVKSGCALDGHCQAVGSFWHDGCTVYTCNEDAAGKSVTQPVPNERMQWPDGHYALLQSKVGCPVDVPGLWATGSWRHHGNGKNAFSTPLNLAGAHNAASLDHQFCVHSSSGSMTSPLRYRTSWGAGSYCILRSNGLCPAGFGSGYVEMDDADGKAKLAQRTGVLPDGMFGPNTGLQFCCRRDGPAVGEIVLPKDRGFVLFMAGGATECQRVTGMVHSMEFFTFNDAIPAQRSQSGVIPRVQTDASGTKIYYCYYSPLDCGCAVADGTYVAVGNETTVACITQRCVAEGGKNVLKTVTEGCPANGRCEKEGAMWSEEDGGVCSEMACVRRGTGGQGQLKVEQIRQGCRDGVLCRDLGFNKTENCYVRQCVMDESSQKPAFVLRKAECPWVDTCKPVNSTWTETCMSYRCDIQVTGGNFRWKITQLDIGCEHDGRCYAVGERTVGKCYEAQCKLNANRTGVFMDVTKEGCQWRRGCRTAGQLWTHRCHVFKCSWTQNRAQISVIRGSCEWGRECKQAGEIWSNRCVEYQCVVSRQGGTMRSEVKTTKLACQHFDNKTCLAVGETVKEQCNTYQCMHTTDRISLEAIDTACAVRGKCHPENSTWTEENCADYRCFREIVAGEPTMQFELISYNRCPWNKTCKAEGEEWQDGCRVRRCNITKNGPYIQRSVAPISAGCDDEGQCKPPGHTRMTRTCQMYECVFSRTFMDAYYQYKGAACMSGGKCYPVNATWSAQQANMCVNYTCRYYSEISIYQSEVVERTCRDADGNCRPVGAAGFDAMVNGVRTRGCSCLASGMGIGISCRQPDTMGSIGMTFGGTRGMGSGDMGMGMSGSMGMAPTIIDTGAAPGGAGMSSGNMGMRIIDMSSGSMGTMSGNTDTSTVISGSMSGNMDKPKASGNLGTVPGSMGTMSGNMGTVPGSMGTMSGNMGTMSGSMNTVSGNVDNVPGNMGTVSGNVDNVPGNMGTVSGSMGTMSGNVDNVPGNMGTASGNVDTVTGTMGKVAGKPGANAG